MNYYDDVRFPENCRSVIDVTKPPYSVDNTGKEDCTEKLCRILDDLLAGMIPEMHQVYERLKKSPDNTYISRENRRINGRIFAIFPIEIDLVPSIYFPNGTYLVSDTVSYRLKNLHNMMYHYTSGGFELNRCIRFIGQNREKTVIKLKDNCKGFEYGQERPVINFMNGERSNVAMSNYFENITVDVGKGNDGAVGIIYFANNSGTIRNVTVRSSDASGSGAIGLWIKNEIHSSANARNLKIEGFDYGIKISTFRTCSHFEDIELNGQKKYGIYVKDNVAQFIGVKSRNNVPIINVDGPMAHVVMTDGDFVSDGTEYTAIKYTMGCLFAKNIKTKGFAAALEENWFEKFVPDGYIDEYSTHDTYTLFDCKNKTAGLKVPALPEVEAQNDFSKWACVNDFGAVGDGVTDDTESIQKAFSSGKEYIRFEQGRYLITAPVEIPETVKHINFMFCDIKSGDTLSQTENEGVFRIIGDKGMLFCERLFSWNFCCGKIRMFRNDSTRTVYMRDMHTQACAFYFNTKAGGEVFFENCACTVGDRKTYHGVTGFTFYKQKAWCHSINPERSDIETHNIGGTLWWSGFKTEQEGSANVTEDGGITEIAGGICVVGGGNEERPVIVNDNSTVSAILCTTGYHKYSSFPVAVKETRNTQTRLLRDSQLPQRYFPWYFLPLYSGGTK